MVDNLNTDSWWHETPEDIKEFISECLAIPQQSIKVEEFKFQKDEPDKKDLPLMLKIIFAYNGKTHTLVPKDFDEMMRIINSLWFARQLKEQDVETIVDFLEWRKQKGK